MITAIVPLKMKSRRLPNKNFLILGEKPLINHIFDTLLEVPEIRKVYCYTSQKAIMKLLPSKIDILPRPSRLDGDEVKANELFRYAVENIDDEIIVICQAPGPFVDAKSISSGINGVLSGDYDCAFAAKKLQTYCWLNSKPINYDPLNMSQTQDLAPVYAETSGFYVFKKEDYLKTNSRINGRPYIVEVNDREAVDIDDPSDFAIAKLFLDYDFKKPVYFDQDNPYLLELSSVFDFSKEISHVSFDLDGVLIDSLKLMEEAWMQVTIKCAVAVDFKYYKDHIGKPFFEILRSLGIDKGKWQEIQNIYEAYSNENKNKVHLMEGVAQSIERFKAAGVVITIVTSKPRKRAESIVNDLLGVGLVDYIICPDDVESGRGKPNPDQILLACIRAGEDPSRTIYVGDMDVDRVSAKRAGVHFVHAGWGYGDISASGEIWFDSVENFSEFILETLLMSKKHG